MELIRTIKTFDKTLTTMIASSAILLLLLSTAHAQNEILEGDKALQETQLKLGDYKHPIPVNTEPAQYPYEAQKQSQEGWVDFNFMINTAGKPYEIEISDHSFGGESFIDSAREAVSKYVYKPAVLDDKPIDTSKSVRLRYQMESYKPEASRQYKFRHREFSNALKEKDQLASAENLKELASIVGLSLDDDAHINLAHYRYELEFGTPKSQLYYLTKSVSNKYQEKYFIPDAYTKLLATLFSLQTQQAYLGEALDTFERLKQRENAEDLVEQLSPAATKIKEIRVDNTVYSLSGLINTSNSWGVSLFKPVFAVTKLEGQIDEIKLYCSQKYAFFRFEKDKQYEIPKSYGDCHLNFIGTPGSTFELIQAAPS